MQDSGGNDSQKFVNENFLDILDKKLMINENVTSVDKLWLQFGSKTDIEIQHL